MGSVYIKTPHPDSARVKEEKVKFPQRRHLLRTCKTCRKNMYFGPYWRFECAECDPSLNEKFARDRRLEQERARYKRKHGSLDK